MTREQERTRNRPFDDLVAERLAWLMDSSIKIGPVSIGLDGLIGLIPGFGDVASNIVSAWIVLRALRNGAHRTAILRMLVNLGIDSLAGAIPLLGDLFDIAYKANTRNIKIYRESLSGEPKPPKDRGFFALVVVILILVIILPILGLIYLVSFFTS